MASLDLDDKRAQAWLSQEGFDPDGDLCATRISPHDPEVLSSAMFEACVAGELDVCRWLFAQGAASTLRTPGSGTWSAMAGACCAGHIEVAKWLFKVGSADDLRIPDKEGTTPMHITCQQGHLELAKWLLEFGGAEVVRVPDKDGSTPMLKACQQGHLDVVKWLYEVGGVETVLTPDNDGDTPMHYACRAGHLKVAKWLFKAGAATDVKAINRQGSTPLNIVQDLKIALWLIINGAANINGATNTREADHVNKFVLLHFMWNLRGEITPPKLGRSMARLLADHSNFTNLLLPAIMVECPRAQSDEGQRRRTSPGLCQLHKLSGLERSVVTLVADFVGVVRGRSLRNLREAYLDCTDLNRRLQEDRPSTSRVRRGTGAGARGKGGGGE